MCCDHPTSYFICTYVHTYTHTNTHTHTHSHACTHTHTHTHTHTQSEGNVDNSVYAHIPDSQLKLTEKGKQQAYVSGITDTGNRHGVLEHA